MTTLERQIFENEAKLREARIKKGYCPACGMHKLKTHTVYDHDYDESYSFGYCPDREDCGYKEE